MTRKPQTIDLDTYRRRAAIDERQRRIQDMIDAHRVEITAGLMLLERMRTWLCDPEVEWLVPESWGWGETGATGVLYGIPYRVVAGLDALFLAQEAKPGA